MAKKHPCDGCIHKWSSGGAARNCAYILNTGHRRGCPAGEGCTRKDTESRIIRTTESVIILPPKKKMPQMVVPKKPKQKKEKPKRKVRYILTREKVRRAMAAAGCDSLREMYERTGVSQSAWIRIRDEMPMWPETACKIADGLGVPVDDIVQWKVEGQYRRMGKE